jgi:hypothetical protein
MTSPKYAKSTARGRQYINPTTGESHPSVTTILGQIGKAEALKWWAASETAKYAVTMRDTWINLDEQAAIDLLKREPLRSLNRAADRGTDVHAIADNYATTGRPPEFNTHGGYVDAMMAFFNDHQPLPILAEKTVYGSLGYAGSFDMLCRLPALGDRICILDYKTSKAIYPDTAAQLAAYANAEMYIDDEDNMQPMIKAETGVIVRFGADGNYEVQEADLEAGWAMFTAALAVYQAQSGKMLKGNVMPVDTYDLAGYRANIIERVTLLRNEHQEQYDVMRTNWIAGLPPLSSDQQINRHQLALLDNIVGLAEAEAHAPFNPPPAAAQIKPPPSRIFSAKDTSVEPVDLEVAIEEVEQIRAVLNAASREVKDAVKLTTQEASAAKTTLSMQGKPTLRRALIAHIMLDCYTEDPTRVIMQGLLNHHYFWDHNTIGSSLGKLDIPQISALAETVKKQIDGDIEIEYDGATNSITIKGANK